MTPSGSESRESTCYTARPNVPAGIRGVVQ